MKYIGRLLGWILLAANLLWVCGLLFCAYSPYIDPVRHPVQACAGLAFPVFLVGTVLFLLFWLVVYSVRWNISRRAEFSAVLVRMASSTSLCSLPKFLAIWRLDTTGSLF